MSENRGPFETWTITFTAQLVLRLHSQNGESHIFISSYTAGFISYSFFFFFSANRIKNVTTLYRLSLNRMTLLSGTFNLNQKKEEKVRHAHSHTHSINVNIFFGNELIKINSLFFLLQCKCKAHILRPPNNGHYVKRLREER